jgi:hypothetical protein
VWWLSLTLTSSLWAQQPPSQTGPGNLLSGQSVQPQQKGPARPAPRSTAGRVVLGGSTPAEKGVWVPTTGLQTPLTTIATVPFQPWARALYADRQKHELEPYARCKPSGVAREVQTPYGVEILDLSEAQRLYFFDIGGAHTFRTVYMDGRTHPRDLQPSYYGHSIGWWDGDTLVIESTGFNERFWLDRRGIPHTEKLRTLERLTRTDFATIKYEVTIDDPDVYTAPWTGGVTLRWEEGTELFEYMCQQANYSSELMLGSADQSTPTPNAVP